MFSSLQILMAFDFQFLSCTAHTHTRIQKNSHVWILTWHTIQQITMTIIATVIDSEVIRFFQILWPTNECSEKSSKKKHHMFVSQKGGVWILLWSCLLIFEHSHFVDARLSHSNRSRPASLLLLFFSLCRTDQTHTVHTIVVYSTTTKQFDSLFLFFNFFLFTFLRFSIFSATIFACPLSQCIISHTGRTRLRCNAK